MNPAGNEFWSSRDFARVLGEVNFRHFQAIIEKARTAGSIKMLETKAKKELKSKKQ